ncbi:MAG TPA: MBL fold metallo-hydrolase [Candidatus Pacearchaeota archaeon]|nr:MBL fold metallo-hydrolase [Candidatus Pacearchaeota archaeon]HPR79960.1 MBL fold metallo-hydrolase [Candidatus Pacearchaeota archaeon]
MKISFDGACREVTGSCILIESGETKFLVDCGMFQGADSNKNLEAFSFDPRQIDFVLLTHAHLDHCGRLPKLFADGFCGRIYSTAPTRDLTEIILSDALKVARIEGIPFCAPFCTENDISSLINFYTCLKYGEERNINENIRIKMRDSGHILGSSIFEVWINDQGKEKKLVFSGDLGNPPAPIVNDPEFISGADVVFVESTYGDRLHDSKEKGIELLRQKIQETIKKGGVLMIPVFALERTQELLYILNDFIENKKIGNISIFLDSPLAIKATGIYKHYADFYDKESKELISKGDDLFNFKGLEIIKNEAQTGKVDKAMPPKIILAGSGMFEGGKIKSYLKKYLGNSINTLLIISFQSKGSLGINLLQGGEFVEIDGTRIKVLAQVASIFSFSSHGDRAFLFNWIETINKPFPKKIFIIHGEEEASLSLAQALDGVSRGDLIVPKYKEVYEA